MPTFNFKTPKPITLIAKVNYGSVVLDAEPGLEETIIDVQPANPDKAADVDEVARVTVEHNAAANEVRITAHPPPSTGFWGLLGMVTRGSIVVTGKFPATSAVDLTNKKGRLHVRGEVRRADIESGNGSVEVGIVGADGAKLNSRNGHISVFHSIGDLDLWSANGRLLVADCTAKVVARTNSGAIEVVSGSSVDVHSNDGRIEACSSGDLKAHTNNGQIKLGYVATGTAKASTNNGRVTIGVARGANVRVEQAKTLNGTVDNKLGDPLPGAPGGNLSIDVKTNNGGILLERVDQPTLPAGPPSAAAVDTAPPPYDA